MLDSLFDLILGVFFVMVPVLFILGRGRRRRSPSLQRDVRADVRARNDGPLSPRDRDLADESHPDLRDVDSGRDAGGGARRQRFLRFVRTARRIVMNGSRRSNRFGAYTSPTGAPPLQETRRVPSPPRPPVHAPPPARFGQRGVPAPRVPPSREPEAPAAYEASSSPPSVGSIVARLERLPPLQRAVVYREILGPPRGLDARSIDSDVYDVWP